MTIWRKALSLGASAALLASLMATVAAPAAFATTATVTGGGAINPGGPASSAVTLSFTEDAANEWADGSSKIVLFDAAGASKIAFTGTPTVTASGGPAPFACSAALGTTTLANDSLTVSCTGATNTRLDSFSITGLKVKAISGAAIGAVQAQWTSVSGNIDLGMISMTASGTLDSDVAAAAPATFPYTLDAGSPDFQNTDTSDNLPSKVTIGGPTPETVTASNVVANTSFDATTGAFHPAGATVTQTVEVPWLPTLATVGDTTTLTTCSSPTLVRQGMNNQSACSFTVDMGKAGYVAKNATLTFTIATAGAQFSTLPSVSYSGGATVALGTGVLSFDRQSITYTVTTKSTTDNDQVTFGSVKLDIAPTATPGATVDVNLAVSGATVVGNPASIAQVGSTLIGVGAVPTVLIGYNDQPTGLLTLTETAPGTLSDDVSGATNIVRVCLTTPWYDTFVRQPWAVVTAGDLKLNSGGLPVTQVKMTLSANGECASFLIYSQSTVASKVEIRGGVDAASSAPLPSGPNNGAKISVDVMATPGPVTVQVKQDVGTSADLANTVGSDTGAPVIVAMRAYSGSPVVKALGQPVITRGGTQQAAAPITIEETFAGQFQQYEEIELCLVPRSLTNQQDVYFSTSFYDTSSPSTANQPIISTNNETGLVASFEGFETSTSGAGPGIGFDCLEVHIDAAPVVGLGKITVSNIRYDVVADAPLGPVLLNVYRESSGESGEFVAGADFNQTVSNATVGVKAPIAMTAGSSLGFTKIGPFTSATKVAALGKYVTWKFAGGAALAGKTVEIQVATRGATSWSSFTTVTKRVADASGNVYYWTKKSSAAWISVRAYYPGDDSTATSSSPGRQARWR